MVPSIKQHCCTLVLFLNGVFTLQWHVHNKILHMHKNLNLSVHTGRILHGHQKTMHKHVNVSHMHINLLTFCVQMRKFSRAYLKRKSLNLIYFYFFPPLQIVVSFLKAVPFGVFCQMHMSLKMTYFRKITIKLLKWDTTNMSVYSKHRFFFFFFFQMQWQIIVTNWMLHLIFLAGTLSCI